ncbi:phage tail protein [Paraherbaspirillum soli]|uniref:Phage tail protein n=1 Tax=Paraherbaspirillum soli TaxID=631222 RepID=A0ABW0MEZ6_9BURK
MSEASSYLRYLPAIYGGKGSEFVGDYLKIFEKLLSGIDDDKLGGRRGIQELLASEVIGNLFYPRLGFLFDPADTQFMPPISGVKPEKEKEEILAKLDSYIGVPTPSDPLARFAGSQQSAASSQDAVQAWLNGLLNWLGGWVDLTPDNRWDIDKKRRVIAQILALYRLRGTPQGLKMLIDLLLDLPLTIIGVQYKAGESVSISGPISVEVSNPTPPCIKVSDQASTAFIVKDRYQPDTPVVSGYFPWLFEVLIILPNDGKRDFVLTLKNVQQILLLQQQLQQLLASVKPAASKFTIRIRPSMRMETVRRMESTTDITKICNAGTLGVNTLLGIKGES